MKTVAWTGHRPKDLPPTFGFQQFAAILDGLGMNNRDDVEFVTGGALGVDTMAAEYALQRELPLHIILPFKPFVMAKMWSTYDREMLTEHCLAAKTMRVIGGDRYEVQRYDERNHAMVDMADVLFAVWTGKNIGGTANCIRYAHKVKKTVWNLLPADGKLHKVPAIRFTRG